MARIAPTNARGTRDYLPRDLVRRDRVFGILRETFQRYGYEPLETPAIETTAVLEGKYGEEGDRLLFRVLKRGRELQSGSEAVAALPAPERTSAALARMLADEALRYDLTVPLARVVAAHQNEIVFPFRRYQMQPVWRADKPQRGRYREFYQCDVDCVGSRSPTVDAEMVAIHHEVFARLGFTAFVTKINHRGLLNALMEIAGVPERQRVWTLIALDKLDKVGLTGVRAELEKAELTAPAIDKLLEIAAISGTAEEVIAELRPRLAENAEGQRALDDLAAVFRYAAAMGVPAERMRLDLSLARGLGYYTGPIFETVLSGSALGSLGGGGRYDQLIGQFAGREIPCTGISFGLDRIFDALGEQGLLGEEATTTTQALVTLFAPETVGAALELARELREAGVRTEVYAEPKELRAQLAFANKKGIPLAVILGPEEIEHGAVVLRDLRSGTQRAVPRGEAVAQAQALVGGV
ncbi:MAG TPA: histidine--tRNA ligase [Ktedonobacterales bacterium]